MIKIMIMIMTRKRVYESPPFPPNPLPALYVWCFSGLDGVAQKIDVFNSASQGAHFYHNNRDRQRYGLKLTLVFATGHKSRRPKFQCDWYSTNGLGDQ